MSDFSALVFRSKKIESESKDDSLSKLKYDEKDYIQKQLRYNDKSHENVRLNASHAFLNESAFADQIHETYLKPELTMISQLKTRSIFVDQLFAEVRDIQIDLNMIEIKCIEVNECQSVAVQKKDSSRKNKLSNKQWQVLIALHKQLLHEHYDFFLVSQHLSASSVLSRLAARFSMPARM